MRTGFNKWWLLPSGVLVVSVLVALSIVVLKPSFANRSFAEADRQGSNKPTETSKAAPVSQPAETNEPAKTSEPAEASKAATASEPAKTRSEASAANCVDALPTDYACLQKRYQDLVRDSGVDAAFAALKSEMTRNEFARSNCHQMTHIIGRAAAEIYGDIPATYSQGDMALASFCGSGYYHGAMEVVVAKIGPDKILDEANTICANLGGHQKYSLHHYNCAHGLGHGFMGIQENELFESLKTCDTLTDEWERNRCYGGIFMENVIAKNNPGHPSKYLEADRPLYPCDVVGERYKNECYQRQTSYALETQGNDFARVFNLCTDVEDDFRPACYQGLGWDASVQSIKKGTSYATINESTRALCMLGKDYEARLNCAVGAVEYFIRDRYNDTLARAFCDTLSTDLRAGCLQEAEEYYRSLRPPSERQSTSS